MFYILRKDFNPDERRNFIKDLCNIFYISNLDEKKVVAALDNYGFTDFEDCLQEESAVEVVADYNTKSKGFYKIKSESYPTG